MMTRTQKKWTTHLATLLRGAGAEPLTGTVEEILAAALKQYEAEARRQGYEGDDWEATEGECDWAVAHVFLAHGRMPTRREWLEVLGPGAHIGNRHYAD